MATSQAARLVAIALLVACSLDTSGFGHSSAAGSIGGAESSSGPLETGTDDPTSSAGSSSGTATTSTTTTTTTSTAEVTGEVDDGASSSSGDEHGESTTSSGMVDPCSVAPPVELTLEADAAALGGTMMLAMLDDGQQYVYSTEAGTGSATFSFHVDCPGTFAIWALVHDADPWILDAFDDGDGADRMQVDVDADNTDWRYGCQTDVLPWSWEAVGTNNGICTNDQRKEYALAAGDHSIVFTPSEGGMHGGTTAGDTAALMRITITNDLDYVP